MNEMPRRQQFCWLKHVKDILHIAVFFYGSKSSFRSLSAFISVYRLNGYFIDINYTARAHYFSQNPMRAVVSTAASFGRVSAALLDQLIEN